MATINPSTTIVPSIACSGITALLLPPLRMRYSTSLIIAEIIKQILQINTILEKKRIEGLGVDGYELLVADLKYSLQVYFTD